ncbi:hypothetical protein BaRGS_00002308, partial [Batillaria attramentaria]
TLDWTPGRGQCTCGRRSDQGPLSRVWLRWTVAKENIHHNPCHLTTPGTPPGECIDKVGYQYSFHTNNTKAGQSRVRHGKNVIVTRSNLMDHGLIKLTPVHCVGTLECFWTLATVLTSLSPAPGHRDGRLSSGRKNPFTDTPVSGEHCLRFRRDRLGTLNLVLGKIVLSGTNCPLRTCEEFALT